MFALNLKYDSIESRRGGKMRTYHCRGLVKEVMVDNGKVSFKLEPSAPYMFERKAADGTMERCLLFVESEVKSANADKNGQSNASNCQIKEVNAKVVEPSREFKAPIPCWFNTLLIAKANHMRVGVDVDENQISEAPMMVSKFNV